jgi:hypothetical protein
MSTIDQMYQKSLRASADYWKTCTGDGVRADAREGLPAPAPPTSARPAPAARQDAHRQDDADLSGYREDASAPSRAECTAQLNAARARSEADCRNAFALSKGDLIPPRSARWFS